jgi:hypothetical protein
MSTVADSHTKPNPLCDLRDLCAMLSPCPRFSHPAVVFPAEVPSTNSNFPLCGLLKSESHPPLNSLQASDWLPADKVHSPVTKQIMREIPVYQPV